MSIHNNFIALHKGNRSHSGLERSLGSPRRSRTSKFFQGLCTWFEMQVSTMCSFVLTESYYLLNIHKFTWLRNSNHRLLNTNRSPWVTPNLIRFESPSRLFCDDRTQDLQCSRQSVLRCQHFMIIVNSFKY